MDCLRSQIRSASKYIRSVNNTKRKLLGSNVPRGSMQDWQDTDNTLNYSKDPKAYLGLRQCSPK